MTDVLTIQSTMSERYAQTSSTKFVQGTCKGYKSSGGSNYGTGTIIKAS